jgi:hypothetical protein
MKLILAVIAALALSACSIMQPVVSQPTGPASPAAQKATAAGFDIGQLPIAKFTHADLLGAAAYANGNGYPARANVYTAIEAQLTACEQAIGAAAPKAPAPGSVGVFTAYEVAAEAVGQGVPSNVRINCGAIVLP